MGAEKTNVETKKQDQKEQSEEIPKRDRKQRRRDRKKRNRKGKKPSEKEVDKVEKTKPERKGSRKVFVKGLVTTNKSTDSLQQDLEDHFAEYGQIKDVKIVISTDEKKNSFAIIEFEEREAAESAVERAHESTLGENNVIEVYWARNRFSRFKRRRNRRKAPKKGNVKETGV